MALEDFDETEPELDLDIEPLELDADEDGSSGAPDSMSDDPRTRVEDEPTEAVATDDGHAGQADIDLDEDLFDFSSVFDIGTVEPAAPLPESTSDPLDLFETLGDDLLDDPPLEPVFEEPEDPPAPAAEVPEPAPAPDRAPEPALVPAAPMPVGDGLALTEPPVPLAAGSRDKLVMVLAVAFLLLNTALILLAWQANSSFHDTLRGVTASIADGLSNVGAAQPQPGRVEFVPVRTTGHEPQSPNLRSGELDPVPHQSIVQARALMADGRFIDARRTLLHLLANQDLIALQRDLAAEAEFLVAETYALQATALAEERR